MENGYIEPTIIRKEKVLCLDDYEKNMESWEFCRRNPMPFEKEFSYKGKSYVMDDDTYQSKLETVMAYRKIIGYENIKSEQINDAFYWWVEEGLRDWYNYHVFRMYDPFQNLR
jgi:hypothetical protein